MCLNLVNVSVFNAHIAAPRGYPDKQHFCHLAGTLLTGHILDNRAQNSVLQHKPADNAE
jgi:hypothetical protein